MCSMSQEGQSTWCAGTRTKLRRPEPISSRRRETRYSVPPRAMQQNMLRSNLSKQQTLLQEVYVHILDLSETRKVWEFAEGFKKKFKALNVLVKHVQVSFLSSAEQRLISVLLLRSTMQVPS